MRKFTVPLFSFIMSDFQLKKKIPMYSKTAYFMRKSLIIKTRTIHEYGNRKKKLDEHSPQNKLKLTHAILK